MKTFKAGGPLNPQDPSNIIVNRPELSLLLSHIQDKDLYIALHSSRQSGKTTLLYQIIDCLHGNDYAVIYLYMADLRELDEANFYQEISTEICDGLLEFIEESKRSSIYPQKVDDRFAFSRYLCQLSSKVLFEGKLIIVMDEIAGIPESVFQSFFSSLRSFYHKGQRPDLENRDLYRRYIFVFAGASELQRLMQGKNSPLKNICTPFSLEDFTQEQVYEIAKYLHSFPHIAIETAKKTVYDWTDGHPYLTQLAYSLINDSEECRENVNQLTDIVKRMMKQRVIYGNDANIEHIFNHIQDEEKYCKILLAIFRHGGGGFSKICNDLLSIGIIKRTTNNKLIIRNKIYEKAILSFFTNKGLLK